MHDRLLYPLTDSSQAYHPMVRTALAQLTSLVASYDHFDAEMDEPSIDHLFFMQPQGDKQLHARMLSMRQRIPDGMRDLAERARAAAPTADQPMHKSLHWLLDLQGDMKEQSDGIHEQLNALSSYFEPMEHAETKETPRIQLARSHFFNAHWEMAAILDQAVSSARHKLDLMGHDFAAVDALLRATKKCALASHEIEILLTASDLQNYPDLEMELEEKNYSDAKAHAFAKRSHTRMEAGFLNVPDQIELRGLFRQTLPLLQEKFNAFSQVVNDFDAEIEWRQEDSKRIDRALLRKLHDRHDTLIVGLQQMEDALENCQSLLVPPHFRGAGKESSNGQRGR